MRISRSSNFQTSKFLSLCLNTAYLKVIKKKIQKTKAPRPGRWAAHAQTQKRMQKESHPARRRGS